MVVAHLSIIAAAHGVDEANSNGIHALVLKAKPRQETDRLHLPLQKVVHNEKQWPIWLRNPPNGIAICCMQLWMSWG